MFIKYKSGSPTSSGTVVVAAVDRGSPEFCSTFAVATKSKAGLLVYLVCFKCITPTNPIVVC